MDARRPAVVHKRNLCSLLYNLAIRGHKQMGHLREKCQQNLGVAYIQGAGLWESTRLHISQQNVLVRSIGLIISCTTGDE